MSKVIQPKLRFPEFTDNWNIKKFNDLFSFKSTNSLSRENLNYHSGKVKNIHYGDIHTKFESHFDVKKERVPFINPDIDLTKISKDNFLKEGDLVIADASEDYNDIGKTIEIIDLNNEKVLAGLHTFLARKESKDIYTGFPTYLLKTRKVRLDIMKIAQGTKVLSLSSSRLGNILLDIPIYEEQSKIARFLTSIDNHINLLKRKKIELIRYKNGIANQIFNQKTKFKDEDGTSFPEWQEFSLGELGSTFNGLTGKTKVDFGSGKPYIQYMQIFSNSKIDVEKFGLVEIEASDNQNKVQYGDIFFTTSSETPNDIGTSSVLIEEVDEVYLNSFCFGFRPNSVKQLVPEFARYLFRSELFRGEIIKLAQGSTRFNMSKIELLKIKILIPHESEQRKIGAILGNLDNTIYLIEEEILNLYLFKKALLQQMFV